MLVAATAAVSAIRTALDEPAGRRGDDSGNDCDAAWSVCEVMVNDTLAHQAVR